MSKVREQNKQTSNELFSKPVHEFLVLLAVGVILLFLCAKILFF